MSITPDCETLSVSDTIMRSIVDEDFSDTRDESLIICDKLNKSKNEDNDFNKLHPWLLDTLVFSKSSSIFRHFSHKPQGQVKSNFIWSIHKMRQFKYCFFYILSHMNNMTVKHIHGEN